MNSSRPAGRPAAARRSRRPDEVGGAAGEQLQEFDQVEFVDEGVGDLDEHPCEPLRGNGGHGCLLALPAVGRCRFMAVVGVEGEAAGDDVAGHVAQAAVLGVGVGAHPGHRLGQGDSELHHDHSLGLEQLGPVTQRHRPASRRPCPCRACVAGRRAGSSPRPRRRSAPGRVRRRTASRLGRGTRPARRGGRRRSAAGTRTPPARPARAPPGRRPASGAIAPSARSGTSTGRWTRTRRCTAPRRSELQLFEPLGGGVRRRRHAAQPARRGHHGRPAPEADSARVVSTQIRSSTSVTAGTPRESGRSIPAAASCPASGHGHVLRSEALRDQARRTE